MSRMFSILAVALIVASGSANGGQLAEIVERSGLSGGIVVCVGCADLESIGKLSGDGDFVIQVLDSDAAKVKQVRALLQSTGLHGKVTASTFDGTHLPYVDNLLNLVVVQPDANVPDREIQRVLAPLGMAHVHGNQITKPWPDELDTWPHWLRGPDNNAVSQDKMIGISRSLQWAMPPAWGRHHNLLHSINAMVSDNGRIYSIIDEAPVGARSHTDQWALVCRDAFNGLELWKRPMKDWGWRQWSAVEVGGTMRFRGPNQLFRRLAAAGDTVYVTLGFTEPVVAIDGKTGQTIKQYEGTEHTSTILVKGDKLYLAKNVFGDTPGKTIMAVSAPTGQILWERKGYSGVTPQGTELNRFTDAHLTVGERQVFFLDKYDIVALDMETGVEAWRTSRPEMERDVFGHYDFNFIHFCTLVYHADTVFLGQIHPDPRNLNQWQQKDTAVWALDASTGRKLWEYTGMSLAHFTPPDLFVNKGLVWTMRKGDVALVGLEMRTGEVKHVYPVPDMLVGHHHRCYRNKATERFYLAGEEGIEYIDFNTGALDVHHWMRGACAYGIMPANGLIYLPAHACGCHSNSKLNGFLALANRNNGKFQPDPLAGRLEQGPAHDAVRPSPENTSPASWPVYRHDNRRSNSTPSTIATRLAQQWTQSFGGTLTAPIIAGGRVYLAAQDRHEIFCVGAESGDVEWRFAADGRIDTPPTCHGDRLFFGTRSGSVYCLTADRGELVWRFQAAPARRTLAAYGQLESAWPVHGTVLIQDDKVYCLAGRSMNLDAGIFAYVLDVDTGAVLQQTQLQADTGIKGEVQGTVLADILVGDERNLFMRTMRFDPQDIGDHGITGLSGYLRPNDAGLLDPTWYNSAFWKYGGVSAQMLVFDERRVVGIAAYTKQASKSYPHDVFTVGSGYRLFAAELVAGKHGSVEPDPPAPQKGANKKRQPGRKASPFKTAWQKSIPVRAEALVLAGQVVCLAGAPDVADEQDPWGAFENRKGGRLMILAKSDGEILADYRLDSAPVYDAMAAAEGKLFISLKDGSLICFGEAPVGR